jgi:putative nucleotidyltransferase with HDIG domain
MAAAHQPLTTATSATASSEPQSAKYVTSYVCALALASCLSVVFLSSQDSAVSSSDVLRAAGLIAFGVVAELLTFRLPGGGSGSVALIPYVATALVMPRWPAIAIVALAAILGTNRRTTLVKAIFNVAQIVLALTLGTLIYRELGGEAFSLLSTRGMFRLQTAVAGAALLATFAVVNTMSVGIVIALVQGRSVLAVWRDNTLGTITYYLFTLPLSFALAGVYVRFGLVGAAALALPMLGVRQLYITTIQLQRTNRELLELMVKAIEARDPYTSGHSRRVADASVTIARSIGLSAKRVERVRIAALLHDIGKIDESFAPILQKEGKLSEAEWQIMKLHPVKGAELVSTLSDLHDVVAPIRHHHERWDGRGYPDGIAREAIPLAARIITFADTMDAMMTDRPYRRAMTAEEVRREFSKNSGTQFDPELCAKILSDSVWSVLFPEPIERRRLGISMRTPLRLRTIVKQHV